MQPLEGNCMSKGTSGFDFLRSIFGTPAEPTVDEVKKEAKELFDEAKSGNVAAIQEIATGMLHESDWRFSGHFSFVELNTCVLRFTGERFTFPIPSWHLLQEAGLLYADALAGNENARREIMLLLLNKNKRRDKLVSLFSVADVKILGEKKLYTVSFAFLGSQKKCNVSLAENVAKLFKK